MIVKNWMLPHQYSISSDALATEAVMLIREHNLKMLPVLDEGRLRGIVHRRDLSEAAMCVSGSGDACEINYFCSKLKVKDLMVRMPVTVDVNDTVEETLIRGKELTMSTFPVMDGETPVGVVSDREIFVTLFRLLEAGAERIRITLRDVTLEQGTLTEILKTVDQAWGLGVVFRLSAALKIQATKATTLSPIRVSAIRRKFSKARLPAANKMIARPKPKSKAGCFAKPWMTSETALHKDGAAVGVWVSGSGAMDFLFRD